MLQQEQEAWSSSEQILLAATNGTFSKELLSPKPDKQAVRPPVTPSCHEKGKDSVSPPALLRSADPFTDCAPSPRPPDKGGQDRTHT